MRTGLLAPDCAATKKRVTKQAAGTIVRELSLRRAPLARSTTSLFAPSQKLTRPDSLFGKPLVWKNLPVHLPIPTPRPAHRPHAAIRYAVPSIEHLGQRAQREF